MKKLLLILAVISFIFPILYFHLVWYFFDYLNRPSEFFPNTYFFEMSSLLNHWTTGEMGWWQIYPMIFGIVLLVIRANIHKFISDFNRGYVDAMSDD